MGLSLSHPSIHPTAWYLLSRYVLNTVLNVRDSMVEEDRCGACILEEVALYGVRTFTFLNLSSFISHYLKCPCITALIEIFLMLFESDRIWECSQLKSWSWSLRITSLKQRKREKGRKGNSEFITEIPRVLLASNSSCAQLDLVRSPGFVLQPHKLPKIPPFLRFYCSMMSSPYWLSTESNFLCIILREIEKWIYHSPSFL